MRATVSVAVALLLATTASHGASRRDEIVVTHPEQRDPQGDCSAAIRKGDLRFVAIYGFTVETPGVESADEAYLQRYGVKIIAGTSDTDASGFSALAELYATRYNRALMQHLKTKQRSKASNQAMQRTASRR